MNKNFDLIKKKLEKKFKQSRLEQVKCLCIWLESNDYNGLDAIW